MKKLKTLLPILLGVFLLIGGLTMFAFQGADANPEEANCIFDHDYNMCFDYEQFNCTCVVVEDQ